MHKYPEYTFTSYDKEEKKGRTGAAFGAAMFGFVSIGFLIGLALLAVRNWAYLT